MAKRASCPTLTSLWGIGPVPKKQKDDKAGPTGTSEELDSDDKSVNKLSDGTLCTVPVHNLPFIQHILLQTQKLV